MTNDSLLLDALRRAVADPGDHRLFRAGKLPGLFPSRAGPSADAAKQAVATGLLEVVRTEAKGKLIAEWVRATPAGRVWVQDGRQFQPDLPGHVRLNIATSPERLTRLVTGLAEAVR